MREAGNPTVVHRVRLQIDSDNRNALSGRPRRSHDCRTDGEQHIDIGSDGVLHQRSNPRRIAVGDLQNNVDLRVASRAQPIKKCLNTRRRSGLRSRIHHTDFWDLIGLLRARRERPCG